MNSAGVKACSCWWRISLRDDRSVCTLRDMRLKTPGLFAAAVVSVCGPLGLQVPMPSADCLSKIGYLNRALFAWACMIGAGPAPA